MTEVWGFCFASRQDELVARDGLCVLHRGIVTPPTWGRATWKWRPDLACWSPYAPRPAGYLWVQPTDDRPRRRGYQPAERTSRTPRVVSSDCQRCGQPFTAAYPGGDLPRYCGDDCRRAALNDRRRAKYERRAS